MPMKPPEEAEARFKGADGFIYSRYGNPTVSMFEARMAALEGAPAARATASGMAAVTAALSVLPADRAIMWWLPRRCSAPAAM